MEEIKKELIETRVKEKKAYHSPKITEIGDVRDVTLTGTGNQNDLAGYGGPPSQPQGT